MARRPGTSAQPEDFPWERPETDGKRHWTVKGVVVYKQPKRKWTPKDLARITEYVSRDLRPGMQSQDVLYTLVDAVLTAIEVITRIFSILGGRSSLPTKVANLWAYYWGMVKQGMMDQERIEQRFKEFVAEEFGLIIPKESKGNEWFK